jgi:signal transduction histidine kinase
MMTPRKVNCWEDRGCGRGPDGPLADRLGVCPAAADTTCDGANGGTNGGRLCWAVVGARCEAAGREAPAQGGRPCPACSFFLRVKYEEGCHFQPTRPGRGVRDPEALHRLLGAAISLTMVYRDIHASLSIGPLFSQIVEQARRATSASAAGLYLADEAGRELVLEAGAGDACLPPRIEVGGESPAALALRTGGRWQGEAALPGCPGPAQVMALRVGGDDGQAGVLEIVKTDGPFTPDDEWFLWEFGLAAGVGVRSARLLENLGRLKKGERAQYHFMATLMHHVGSPLATVSLCLQALSQLGDRLAPTERQTMVETSLERLRVVQALTRELLDLAAVRSGQYLANLELVSPGEILRREVEARRLVAERDSIELVLEAPADARLVRADPEGLRLVFGSLLDNAIKYSAGKGKQVRAGLSAAGGAVRVWVRDDGIGIPPTELETIFERFRRGASAVAARVPGFGLGLSTVKELVDRYGGRVDVESIVGEGTRFTVELPMAAAEREGARPAHTPHPVTAARGVRP